nr:hypothetical protein [Sinorhizobium meliloti]
MAPQLVDPIPAAKFSPLRSFYRLDGNAGSPDFHAVVREPDAGVIQGRNAPFAGFDQFPQRLGFPAYECDRKAARLVIIVQDVDSDITLVSSHFGH